MLAGLRSGGAVPQRAISVYPGARVAISRPACEGSTHAAVAQMSAHTDGGDGPGAPRVLDPDPPHWILTVHAAPDAHSNVTSGAD